MATKRTPGRPSEINEGVRYDQYLSGDQHRRMTELARENYRSLNAEVRRAVDKYLENEGQA